MARTGLALLLAVFFGWAAGLLVVGHRRHPAVIGVVVLLAMVSGLSLAVIAWNWLDYVRQTALLP